MSLEGQGFPAGIWVLLGGGCGHKWLWNLPSSCYLICMVLGHGHSWVGVFLGWLGEKLFAVMKFRELDFWLFPHFCMSAANAVMAMKLEHLTGWGPP